MAWSTPFGATKASQPMTTGVLHWPTWVQEAWAMVDREINPEFAVKCFCAECHNNYETRRRNIENPVPLNGMSERSAAYLRDRPELARKMQNRPETYRIPFDLDPTLIVSSGSSAAEVNTFMRDTFRYLDVGS